MDLNELIAAVEETGGDNALDRIEVAATIKNQIEAIGDELLDHFVNQARDDGCSWTQIGDALGVTRQAAQQRHGGFLAKVADRLATAGSRLPGGAGGRFTKRARATVMAAEAAARARQHTWIGTEHLLIGLFANDDDNVGARALHRLGVDKTAVDEAVSTLIPDGDTESPLHIPFTPRGKAVLESALGEALKLGHNYIGCEHIALALLTDADGVAAHVLADRDVTHDKLRAEIVELLSNLSGSN